MKESQRMRKRILVLLLLGSTVMVHGDALPIHLVWDQFIANGTAQSVALHRNRAIVGVVLERFNPFQTELSVRGFNATTGNLVWEDHFPGLAIQVEAAQDYAIAVGALGGSLEIHSYDLQSGTIRWTMTAIMDSPQKILIRQGRLVIVGLDYNPDLARLVGIVLVFDASTGAALWNTTIAIEGSHVELWDVDDAGRNIILVGTQDPGDTPAGPVRHLFVRSYRLRDGELRWEVIEPTVFARVLLVQNGLAVVGGFEPKPGNPSSSQSFLTAYRVADGLRQWKAESVQPGAFLSLAATTTALIAGGAGDIEAHDPLTGNRLWSSPTDYSLRELILIGNQVATIGTKTIPVNPPRFDRQLIVRVIDAAGQLVAEDVRETGPGNFYYDGAFLNGRLAVVGRIGEISGGALVRVYDMRPFE
jgi:PQQ-like domain